MTEVALATLRADVWNTVYNAISLSASTLGISTIVNSYPDFKDSVSYPLLVVTNPKIRKLARYSSVNNTTPMRPTTVILDLYTKKNLQIDTIMDALCNQLESIQTSTFDASAMYWLEMEENDPTIIVFENGQRIHNKVLTLSFKVRI